MAGHGRHGTRENHPVHRRLLRALYRAQVAGSLSLTEKEVTIKDMPSEEALKAFLNGEGDAVALWSPYTLEAEQHGLMPGHAVQPVRRQPAHAAPRQQGVRQGAPRSRNRVSQDVFPRHHSPSGNAARTAHTGLPGLLSCLDGPDLPPQDAAWELAKHPSTIEGQLTLFDPARRSAYMASGTGLVRRWQEPPQRRHRCLFEETRPIAHTPRKTERQPSPEGWRFFVWDCPLKLSIKPDKRTNMS